MEEKLSEAIISDDLEFLKSYLDKGEIFDKMTLVSPDGYGRKPLELAVLSQIYFKGSSQITKLVQENSSEEDQAEVLVSFASEEKHLEKMKILLESGLFVDLVYNHQTALQRATGNRNLKMAHLLLSYGADPNKDGEYGTALEEAKDTPVFEEMMLSFMKGEPKSPFDFVDKDQIIEKLNTRFYCLKDFAKNNKDHTFYILAIDGGRLKANSVEKFESTLKEYQEEYPEKYTKEENIRDLKFNPGNFSFYQIEKEIDPSLNKIDLNLTFIKRQENDNRTEKDLLIDGLQKNIELFTKEMNITNDFKIIAPGHIY